MTENPSSGSLIVINTGLLNALSKGQLNIDVFKKDLLALECKVAGTSFRKLDSVEAELTNTVKLEMKREAKNEFDDYAIALYFKEVKVGYVPRDKNEVIARLMDAGKGFYATIQASSMEGKWLKLDIKIFMQD